MDGSVPARPRQVRANKINLAGATQVETPSQEIINRTASAPVIVTDDTGRVLKVKRLKLVDHMKIARVLGPELSKNDVYKGLACLAFSLIELDGEIIIPPIKPSEVEVLVGRLGDEGAMAIGKAYADNGWSKTGEDTGLDLDAAKN